MVAFEDPDGSKLRSVLADRYLYAFGNIANVKKWKHGIAPQCPWENPQQTPPEHNNGSDTNDEEDIYINLNVPRPRPLSTAAAAQRLRQG